MCTLTFFPKHDNSFILTSNRDESPGRETLHPAVYEFGDAKLLYPKDVLAGGTWIGLSDKSRLVCLLNGGFTAHERLPEYRMSRGIIVTDLLAAGDPLQSIAAYDFYGIEPFTLVMVDWSSGTRIHELVWDGELHHLREMPLQPLIWSSSLLYSEAMKRKREQWFSNFVFEIMDPDQEQILNFHKTAGEGDPNFDLIMDRGFVKTKSITQIQKSAKLKMRYEDIEEEEVTELEFGN